MRDFEQIDEELEVTATLGTCNCPVSLRFSLSTPEWKMQKAFDRLGDEPCHCSKPYSWDNL